MNLALFDFDGTITQKDAFTPFLLFASLKRRKLFVLACLWPCILLYKLGIFPAHKMRPLIAFFCFMGKEVKTLDTLGQDYARSVLPKNMRTTSLDRIRWHKERGDHVIVVSASLDTYLKPWCKSMGVDLICSTLEKRGQHYTGRYVQGDCSYEQKSDRVKDAVRLENYQRIFAYGDTREDKQLLALATDPTFQWAPFEGFQP